MNSERNFKSEFNERFNPLRKMEVRYERLIAEHGLDGDLMKPEKTLLASFAALEFFSKHRLEDLHKAGLVVPVVLLYKSLACRWDDCVDVDGKDGEKAWTKRDEKGESAQSFWRRGINLLSSNINIMPDNKSALIQSLEKAKDEYLEAELDLKNPANFEGLSPEDMFKKVLELRKRSFANIARVMTRVFTKGVENPKLEDLMAKTTLAYGIFDGFNDLKEDEKNGTMTEARALVYWLKRKI